MLTPEGIVPALLNWFEANARPLPWRKTRDPYAIWISEVMLQQTQVQTVIPYWKRWMQELPNVKSLARAKADKVLKLWEGLGYYSRARNLHRAAGLIVELHRGSFPTSHAALLELPGVGRYTAGAICSIAFDQPSPILDGNVTRVLARLFGIRGSVRTRQTQARLWKLSERLVQAAAARCGDHPRPCSSLNQALMELGASVCRPQQPVCDRCPVADHCAARRTRQVASIPDLGKRAVSTRRHFAAFIVPRDGKILVRRRPDGVVNAGLWEFPNVELTEAGRNLKDLVSECIGYQNVLLEPIRTIHHTITRYRIQLDVFQVHSAKSIPTSAANGNWLTLAQLKKRAFPSAHRRILELLSGEGSKTQRQ